MFGFLVFLLSTLFLCGGSRRQLVGVAPNTNGTSVLKLDVVSGAVTTIAYVPNWFIAGGWSVAVRSGLGHQVETITFVGISFDLTRQAVVSVATQTGASVVSNITIAKYFPFYMGMFYHENTLFGLMHSNQGAGAWQLGSISLSTFSPMYNFSFPYPNLYALGYAGGSGVVNYGFVNQSQYGDVNLVINLTTGRLVSSRSSKTIPVGLVFHSDSRRFFGLDIVNVSGVEHWCVVSLSSNMTDEKVIYAFGGNLFEGSWTLDYPVYYAAINEFAQIAIKENMRPSAGESMQLVGVNVITGLVVSTLTTNLTFGLASSE